MFTSYHIAFHAVSWSFTIQCEPMFFCQNGEYDFKIFNVKHVFDKSKHLSEKVWSGIDAKNWVFVVPFSSCNVWHFVVPLLLIMVFSVSSQLKSRFVESKCSCQRIKPRFVVCISLRRIQNRYKKMDAIGSLFHIYLACNFCWVAQAICTW